MKALNRVTDKHLQAYVFCRAELSRTGKPPIIEFGRGKTYKEAEASIQKRVLKKYPNRPIEGWVFHLHCMRPSKFKLGDKVRWLQQGPNGPIHKVLALPTDDVRMDGAICFSVMEVAGFIMPEWADQDGFVLVNDTAKKQK
jgi:hypothetical protein